MKFGSLLTLSLCLVLLSSAVAWAQLAPSVVADREVGLYKVQTLDGEKTLYNMHWVYERHTENGGSHLLFTMKGDNDTQGAGRIEWDEEAKMAETATGLRTLYWKKTSRGAEQMDWHLDYDWNARVVRYSFKDRATGKSEKKEFQITDKTLPGDALYLLLRGFPFKEAPGYRLSGKVITGDSEVNGDIVHRGIETITTPLGTFKAYKLELKPKGVIGWLPTKLYMWFTMEAPHICLRFDGLEGLTRTKTVTYEFSPMP
ncbi:MAG: hypothetical protein P9L99_02765 [Candidatus Lernaella stagnicola]|nr:hypothetical protein [Candidatus Lernaella stagnicola]